MREEFVEVLVKCKKNVGLAILSILLYALCAVTVLGGFAFGSFIAVLVGGVLGFCGALAGSKSSVEYEYTYCDKEIDVDVIYSQQKRKRVITLDVSKMEALVCMKADKFGEYKNRQFVTKDFSSKRAENLDNAYAMIYEGNIMYILEPGERLLNALSYVCPRKIFKN